MSKSVYRSFAGGEITPELVARADLAQNQTGLALCENFIVRQNGTLVRRGGLKHIAVVRRISASEAAFVRPTILPAMMKNGDQFGIVADAGVPWLVYRGNLANSSFANVLSIAGNVLTVSAAVGLLGRGIMNLGKSHVFRVASQSGAGPFDITIEDVDGVVMTAARVAFFFGANLGQVHNLTLPAISTNMAGIGGGVYRYSQDNDIITYSRTLATSGSFGSGDIAIQGLPITLPLASDTAITINEVVQPPTGVAATATVATGTGLAADRYYVSSVAPDQTSESAVAASAGTASNLLETNGNYNTVTWAPPGSGPTPIAYRVYYAPANGAQRIFVGESAGLSFVHDKRTPLDAARRPVTVFPTYVQHPAVAHHEQRRWFSGAEAQQQTVIASRIGAQNNYTSSFPLRADDALNFRLNSNQQAGVRHLVPFVDLLAFSQSNVFRIYSPTAAALSPASLAAKPQGNVGSHFTQPVVTPASVIFAQAGGDKLRELQYVSQGTGAFSTADVSSIASHLFYNRVISSITYTQAPGSIVWALNAQPRDSAAVDTIPTTSLLYGMTYVPETGVRAWQRLTVSANDYVMCCTALREQNRDRLYLVVARKTPDTDGYDLCLEQLVESSTSNDIYDGVHLDRHFFREGGPITTVPFLQHLAGETVTVLGDGSVYPAVPVAANGTIALPVPMSRVAIGRQFPSRMRTLPMWAENAGTTKNASGVRIRILNSSFLRAGPAFDKLTEYQARQVSTPFDVAQPLRTMEARLAIGPSWNDDGNVCVEQSLPLPLTVCGMSVEYAPGS